MRWPSRISFCCFVWAALAVGTPASAQGDKVPAVHVVQPVKKAIASMTEHSGRIEPQQEVELRPRISGPIVKIHFREGAETKRGDLLFEIDSTAVRAEADRAEANLQLAEAALRAAKADLARAIALLKNAAISREEYEKSVAQAQVAEANLRLAQITREAARLQLEYTQVRSPIDGRIGIALVGIGGTAKAHETPLAVIVNARPCFASFRVDGRSLTDIADAQKTPVRIAVGEESEFTREAKLDFVDNRADPKTGTILMRATLPNEDGKLFPGAFCRVRLMGQSHEALLIPSRCVREVGKRKVVFVINENKAEARTVDVGQELDGMRVIRRGLVPGELVAADGFDALADGATVRPIGKSP